MNAQNTEALKAAAVEEIVGDIPFTTEAASPFELLPNPRRGVTVNKDGTFADGEYRLIQSKIDIVAQSIRQSGFWSGVEARLVDGKYEIAFGHHRIAAAQALGLASIPLTVRDFTDEQMFILMANENMFDSEGEHQAEHDRMVVRDVRDRLNDTYLSFVLADDVEVLHIGANGNPAFKPAKAYGEAAEPLLAYASDRSDGEASAAIMASKMIINGAGASDVRAFLGDKIWPEKRIRAATAALGDSAYKRAVDAKAGAERENIAAKKIARDQWRDKIDVVEGKATQARSVSVSNATLKAMTDDQRDQADDLIEMIKAEAKKVQQACKDAEYPDVPVLDVSGPAKVLNALVTKVNDQIEDKNARAQAKVDAATKKVDAATAKATRVNDALGSAKSVADSLWSGTDHDPTLYTSHYDSIPAIKKAQKTVGDLRETWAGYLIDLFKYRSIKPSTVDDALEVVAKVDALDERYAHDICEILQAARLSEMQAEGAYKADRKADAISDDAVSTFDSNAVQARFRSLLEKLRDKNEDRFFREWSHSRQIDLARDLNKSMGLSSDLAGKFDKVSALTAEATLSNRFDELVRHGYWPLVQQISVGVAYSPVVTSSAGTPLSHDESRSVVFAILKGWAQHTAPSRDPARKNPLEGVAFPAASDIKKVLKKGQQGAHALTSFVHLLGDDEVAKSEYTRKQLDLLDRSMWQVVEGLHGLTATAAEVRDRLEKNVDKADLVSQHEASLTDAVKAFAAVMRQIDDLRKQRDAAEPALQLPKSA